MRRLQRTLTDIQQSGPLIELTTEPVIGVQQLLHRSGESIPSLPVTALIDTGAAVTTTQTTVIARLGLLPLGTVFLNTPSTTEPILCFEYRVRHVLHKTTAFETDVVAAPMGGQTVQCLLGRDILRYIVMTYNGPKNSYTLKIRSAEDE